MKTRIMSGTIGLIALLFIIFTGGILLDFSVAIISFIALYEFINVIKLFKLKPLYIHNYLLILSFLLVSITDKLEAILPILFIYIISTIMMLVFKESLTPIDVGINLFGGLYTIFFPFHVAFINGNNLIWLIFITAFASDTFAYFTGKMIGRHKLSPNLSPNKTIEGAIGGILGSLLLTILFIRLNNLGNYIELSLLSIICSMMSIIGDLSASKVKRIVKIKDFGNIMPGHGGVLDRFDSILFTAPIVYYYITYIL